jgi:hypothetical protein
LALVHSSGPKKKACGHRSMAGPDSHSSSSRFESAGASGSSASFAGTPKAAAFDLVDDGAADRRSA